MNTAERAYERLVTANPVPDPERNMATGVDFGVGLRDMGEFMMDTKTNERDTTEHTSVPRSWRVATAAFVAVLVVGGALLVATVGNDDSSVVGNTSVDVVDAFFERWNAGDAAATMALVDPEVRVNGGAQGVNDLRSLVEFAIEFEGSMEAECSASANPGQATCNWAWATAGTEALDIPGWPGRSFTVVDGMITDLTTPTYAEFEAPLRDFAQAEDPEAFAAECSPDGVSPISGSGFPFNQRCGRFLADMEATFVAGLEG